MLELDYREDGKAYSDFDLLNEAQKIIDAYISGKVKIIAVGTGNIIEALRVLSRPRRTRPHTHTVQSAQA